jgi:LmbE family N-acetylglucosaminyl deacetylase
MGSLEGKYKRYILMQLLDFKEKKIKILCLGSHPDDIEIGCGGTILKLTSNFDTEVIWIVFSGTDERKNEALISADKFLKNSDKKTVVIKEYKESFFPYQGDMIKKYFYEIQKHDPDLIFTHFNGDSHQDHKIISELTWNTFRNNTILEYEIPKYDGDLSNPNLFITLDKKLCKEKIDNICNIFKTQQNKHWFDEQTFWSYLTIRGIESKSSTRFAEGFFARKIVM